MKPTPDQLEAFLRIRGSYIHAYFTEALDDCRNQLETQPEHNVVLKIQGDVSRLRSVLRLIEGTGKQALSP
jgi:hypothetical protein